MLDQSRWLTRADPVENARVASDVSNRLFVCGVLYLLAFSSILHPGVEDLLFFLPISGWGS